VQSISSSEPIYEKPILDPYDDDEILIPGSLMGSLCFVLKMPRCFLKGRALTSSLLAKAKDFSKGNVVEI
jgi:hypothetical protein